ncbi:flavin reductase family protein [Pseudonocardia sp. C8]|uniref:flavin reductase family protein n=1 Tax=Pseudonocardia sp. C8 TaxID=2762759 RepID=UPI001642C578|nr:flavin reductase family protein [Pseudonocardia sp. C8]MBC3193762.1 flavin reductase family protein [Pseudonocardia sp. C8]
MTGDLSPLQEAFRTVMAGVCTPVSVVTTVELFGRPHGSTVSAFTSLSMSPPMVLVSLDSASTLLGMVEATGTFGINVLAAGQSDVALRFATKGPGRFTGVSWTRAHGAARLDGIASWLACSVADIVEGGDHRILLGDVVSAAASDLEPLTYHARTFGTHQRHGVAS